jgi:hypothetical protein
MSRRTPRLDSCDLHPAMPHDAAVARRYELMSSDNDVTGTGLNFSAKKGAASGLPHVINV